MVIAASCFFDDQQNVVYTYMFCTNLVKTDACQNTNIFLFDIHGGIMREMAFYYRIWHLKDSEIEINDRGYGTL